MCALIVTKFSFGGLDVLAHVHWFIDCCKGFEVKKLTLMGYEKAFCLPSNNFRKLSNIPCELLEIQTAFLKFVNHTLVAVGTKNLNATQLIGRI